MQDVTKRDGGDADPHRLDAPQSSRLRRIGDIVLRWREASILLACVLLAVYFQSTNSTFLSVSNIKNLIDFTATTAIIAAGEVMVLVCGELDLSVGMVYALVPFVMHFLIADGVPSGAAMVLALAAAGMIGLVNGAITTFLSVPAFVTTLGTMFLINGLTLTISGGFPVEPQAGAVFTAAFGGSPWARLAWALAIAIVLQFVLNRTRFGLHTIATGGNLVAAAEVGIKVTSIKISNFVLCSVLGGFAGVIELIPHRLDRSARGRIRDHVHGHRLGGDRRHASDRRLRNCHRRPRRRAGAGDPPGRLHAQRGERLHFRHDPRRRDPFDHGVQRPADHVAGTGRRMMATPVGPEVLRAEHVEKSFGKIVALRDVNLTLRRGEVLGLLGDNGAGKSTLMKIFTGYYRPSAGQLYFEGRPVQFRSVSHARSLGVEAVYQDLALVNELNVYRNMFLQREPVFGGPLGILDESQMRRRAIEMLERMRVRIPSVDVDVAKLSGGQRQAVAIARSVYQKAKVLLLDEPTAAMGAKELALILELIQRLKESGEVAMIIVAHNYAQIFDVCDRINLVEEGAITFDKPTSETSVQEMTDRVVREYRSAREVMRLRRP